MQDGVAASLFAALLPTTQTMSISDFLARDPTAMDSTSTDPFRNMISCSLRSRSSRTVATFHHAFALLTLPHA